MKPTEILKEFDAFLTAKGLAFEAVVIGGAALALLGVVSRETQDCDVLDPSIPKDIEDAAQAFSRAKGLKADWLNNGPDSLREILPDGWRGRLIDLYSGKALALQTLGRADLLRTKFFAYCDRQQDLSDCVALKPSREELSESLEWLKLQDAHPGWPEHVQKSMAALAKRLGYEL